ncbi:alpha-E domain-containing protein [Ottowia sp.]|nr:alpha-E domain-containing protein [Ottowia sp.]HRN76228.1 alpha-E domain-containing protein [Ottowia sp.]HRQ02245.1 alpha-E domain-containing protein [Ottowia sp.]
MLSRTADHLFWMSRYTERAVLFAPVDRVRQHHNTAARVSVPGFEA